jgi:RND family efflux transporter MFP subunit
MFKKFILFLKKRKVPAIILSGLVLIAVLAVLFQNGSGKEEYFTVKTGDFVNQVSVSGKVVPAENVELGFKASGAVAKVYFSVGDIVKKGQVIAKLELADTLGALKTAEANYEKVLNGATGSDIDVAKAAVQTAQVALDQAKAQQDILVKNAHEALLNTGLAAVSENFSGTSSAPEISGTYQGEKEGQIFILQYPGGSGKYFQTNGLISATGFVSVNAPQPIGNSGLYIKYADEDDTSNWTINIPNPRAAGYVTYSNAYQSALSTRNQTIANAEAVLNQAKASLILKEAKARPEDIKAAEGAVLSARGAYNDKFVFAPFNGIVTKLDTKVGEIVSPTVSKIAMMSDGVFQIESYVPEVRIADIKLEDAAEITLDAYGERIPFSAEVVSIDPAETIKDGVSTYKVKLQFPEKDSRIKSVMTANVLITVFRKPNALVVPAGVILEKNGKKFVRVKKDKTIEEREITTGAISSLGRVEVISGLADGESIILNPEK